MRVAVTMHATGVQVDSAAGVSTDIATYSLFVFFPKHNIGLYIDE